MVPCLQTSSHEKLFVYLWVFILFRHLESILNIFCDVHSREAMHEG